MRLCLGTSDFSFESGLVLLGSWYLGVLAFLVFWISWSSCFLAYLRLCVFKLLEFEIFCFPSLWVRLMLV